MIEFRFLKIGDAEPVLQYRDSKPPQFLATEEPWQTVPTEYEDAPPPAPRHWSDVLDVQLDDNREKVDKKFRQLRRRYNGVNLDRDKLKQLDQAWDQYLKDTK